MGDKKADSQARAELLGQLLNAVGESSYMLVHGDGRDSKYLVMLRVTDDQLKELSASWKREPAAVAVGPLKFLPLSLEAGAQPGDVPAALYDAAAQRWTGSIAVRRFK
ncbi:MAG: hypothetical protein PHR35_02595 [Kiritimatiellae bacterium]|nr:hypothetical protein [Kiritimatiellia bacterium]